MCVYTDASDEWLLGCYKYDYGIRTDASVSAWLSHHSLGHHHQLVLRDVGQPITGHRRVAAAALAVLFGVCSGA